MQDTRTGTVIRAHAGCGADVSDFDLLGVHDEQGDGVRRLVLPRLVGMVVAGVGSQAGYDSPGVGGLAARARSRKTRGRPPVISPPTASGAMAESPQL